jgi:Sec-independent protein translocase protein TatA
LGLYLSEFVVILVAAVFAFSFGRTGEVVRDLRQALAKVRTVVNRRKLREIEELRWAPFAAAATIGRWCCRA